MWIASLLISVALLWQCTEGISGMLKPCPTYHVGEGDTAAFTCTVTGRDRSTQTLLWQLGYRDSGEHLMFLRYPANMPRIDPSEIQTPWTHGQYFLSYADENNDGEIIQLEILNVTKGDGNFQFNCAYRSQTPGEFETIIVLGEPVKLTVWIKPTCNGFLQHVQSDFPSAITPTSTISVILTCSTDPDLLILSWYKIENEIRVPIETGLFSTNSRSLSLTLDDYGREYICGATTVNDVDVGLTCSIVPYNPRLELRYNTLVIESGDNFTARCTYNNNEAPKPETNFSWYIGSILIDNDDEMVQISQTKTDASLYLGNRYLPTGHTKITCESVILGIARANTSVEVTVEPSILIGPSTTSTIRPSTAKTATTGNNTQAEIPLVIISAAAVCGLVVFIALITLCCCYRRRKIGKHTNNVKNSEQFNTTTPSAALQSANENDASYQALHKDDGNINQTYTSLKQDGVSSKETVTSDYEVCSENTSRSAVANTSIPFYASSIEFSK